MTNSTRSYAERAFATVAYYFPSEGDARWDKLEALMQELVNETREDCAKVADSKFIEGPEEWCRGNNSASRSIAKAIRKEKGPEGP